MSNLTAIEKTELKLYVRLFSSKGGAYLVSETNDSVLNIHSELSLGLGAKSAKSKNDHKLSAQQFLQISRVGDL